MSDEQITPKRRGRPPKNPDARIGNTSLQPPPPIRETPAIKEGAHWQVGVPEEEQDELKRRHNEAMQNKITETTVEGTLKAMQTIAENFDPFDKAIASTTELTADSAIQIKEGPNRGVICQVGQVQGDNVQCYMMLPNGERTYLSTKIGEFIVLCPRMKGMIALKWTPREQAPDWHETKVHVPEGN